MCECGCGDGDPLYKFPAPNGKYYVFYLYPGCLNCDAPIGIHVDLFTKELLEEWDLEDLPDAPFNEFGDRPEFALPILHPEDAIGALNKEFGTLKVCESGEDHEDSITFKEMLGDIEFDHAKEAILDGSRKTIKKFLKETK